MTVETQEPARLTLPENIRSLLIVNNGVQQPDEVCHRKKPLGKKEFEPVKVSTDSASIYYTEALTQFLSEEHYFDTVILYNKPLRADTNFWEEKPIMPERMNELRKETETGCRGFSRQIDPTNGVERPIYARRLYHMHQ